MRILKQDGSENEGRKAIETTFGEVQEPEAREGFTYGFFNPEIGERIDSADTSYSFDEEVCVKF